MFKLYDNSYYKVMLLNLVVLNLFIHAIHLIELYRLSFNKEINS